MISTFLNFVLSAPTHLIDCVGGGNGKVVPNVPLPVAVPREVHCQRQGLEPALLPSWPQWATIQVNFSSTYSTRTHPPSKWYPWAIIQTNFSSTYSTRTSPTFKWFPWATIQTNFSSTYSTQTRESDFLPSTATMSNYLNYFQFYLFGLVEKFNLRSTN